MTTTLEIGDAVRASVGGGLFVHGELLELRGEEAKVRGRWVPLSGVITEEALEDKKHEAVRTESRLRIAEQTAELEAAFARKPASGWGTGCTEYERYEGNENLFKHDLPLDLRLGETWWLIGYCVDRAVLSFYAPKSKIEANKLGLKYSRGATKHVKFPNPEYPGLDISLRVFFDAFTGGINSKAWFDFLNDGNGSVRQIVPPEEFKGEFEAGRASRWT